MKIVVLLNVRNDELYLARCLDHIFSQGLEAYVWDHASTDQTLAIAARYQSRGDFNIAHLPYDNAAGLAPSPELDSQLARDIKADWFVCQTAAEILQAPLPYRNLREAIVDADQQGFDAIACDEFVFVPADEDDSFAGRDYVNEMKYYYYFKAAGGRPVRAWKKRELPALQAQEGRHTRSPRRKILPRPLVLRRYCALSRAHALEKLCGTEVPAWRWHGHQEPFMAERLRFPPRTQLKQLSADGTWDRSAPQRHHLFIGPPPARNPIGRLRERLLASRAVNDALKDLLVSTNRQAQEVVLTPMPVVVGAARSGTTLLRLMLNAHPDLAVPHETNFVPLVATRRILCLRALLGAKVGGDLLRTHLYRTMVSCSSWQRLQVPAGDLRECLDAIEPFTLAQGLRCFYRLYAARDGKSRWGDKTPHYGLVLDTFQRLLPEAHFIHVIRDGRDVAVSLQETWWAADQDILRRAGYWVSMIRRIRQQARACRRYMEVRYEDLVLDPARVLKAVCAFVELPYDDRMLAYHQRTGDWLEAYQDFRGPDGAFVSREQLQQPHRLTALPPQQSRVGRWREHMSEAERSRCESVAGNLLRDLGYPV